MRTPTRDRILAAATDLFGVRGFDSVSLDAIATDVGVAKQTLLYWFPSKDDLLQAVLVAVAEELTVVIEAAVRAAPDDPLDRIEAVVRAVFRPAVRRPALLGLVREISRLPPSAADRLVADLQVLTERAVAYLDSEMAHGRLRRADPRLVA
jgi:AcrR family transcriptional regulator